MNIQQVDIKTILPYQNNPRKNDKAVETVANSIEQYGFQQPIVVDKNMVIIVGHTRYRAAKKLGLTTIPVSIADQLTEEQAKAYRIMDNRSNENSVWDEDMLYKELEEMIKVSTAQEVSYETGFTESELNKLFKETEEDPIADYIKNETYKSQRGDLWTLGSHKILCGDSTSPEDVKKLLDKEKIDLVWEDPPYGVSYETANGINYTKEQNEVRNHKIANDNLSPEQLDAFLNQHLSAVIDYVKPGAVFYWCHDIRFTQQFRDLLTAHKIHISDTLIWKKDKHSTWLSNYAKYYEPILYGWKQGAEHAWYGKSMQPNAFTLDELKNKTQEQLIKIIQEFDTNYQEFSREKRDIAMLHPTVKPVKLIVYHIINSSKVGQIVYDGFSGSGSTLIAAEKTGRVARCIEYEPKFVDVTIQRWQQETGLKAIRHDGVLWDDVEITLNQDVITNLSNLFDLEIHNDTAN
jgi:ParB/RepB/Spo0J family partition protein